MDKYSFERTSTETYKIRNRDSQDSSWLATIMLEYPYEKHGKFVCTSEWGTYSYHWNAIGSRHFKEFLVDLDDGYVINKLYGGRPDYLDVDASIAAIKREIIKARRTHESYRIQKKYTYNPIEWETIYMDKDLARTCWEEAESLDECKSVDDWFREGMRTEYLYDIIWGGEPHGVQCKTDVHPRLKAFMEKVWHPFMTYLLENEFEQIQIPESSPARYKAVLKPEFQTWTR